MAIVRSSFVNNNNNSLVLVGCCGFLNQINDNNFLSAAINSAPKATPMAEDDTYPNISSIVCRFEQRTTKMFALGKDFDFNSIIPGDAGQLSHAH